MKNFDNATLILERRHTLATELDNLLSDMLLLSAVFRARGLDLEAEELCELCNTSLERYMGALAQLADRQVEDSAYHRALAQVGSEVWRRDDGPAAESTSMQLEAEHDTEPPPAG